MSELRVFLADDHAVVREGMRALINGQPDMTVVGEAGDGRSAIQSAPACNPDIVVVDIAMPRLNGVQVTAALREACPDTRIIALTMHEERGYVWELMNAGASGYILKRSAAEELIHAIRKVAAGEHYLDPALTRHVVAGLNPRPQTPGVTEREENVLRLIAQGYANKEIAVQLGISIKTVETHKARAMEKLDLGSRVDIVRYAISRNWMQQG